MAGHNHAVDVSPEVVQEHHQGWTGFTRLMTIGTICVLILLFCFMLQFLTGWGFAMFLMILGFVLVGLLMLIGKL